MRASREAQVAAAVSAALKGVEAWKRRSVAEKFARRMRRAEARVRENGARLAGMAVYPPLLPRGVVNALCWGCGDEHNRALIARYRAAAQAAERFCRSRR